MLADFQNSFTGILNKMIILKDKIPSHYTSNAYLLTTKSYGISITQGDTFEA